jgi:hypothetical protein
VNRRVVAEKSAPYVSLSAAIGLGLAPMLWDYANVELTVEQAPNRAARDISFMMAAVGTDAILATAKSGALRGSV